MFPGSTYRVQVTGLVDGAAFSKDFTFMTGGVAFYNACITATNLRINNNWLYGGAGYLTIADRDRDLGYVAGYCSGGSGGNLLAPTTATLARIF